MGMKGRETEVILAGLNFSSHMETGNEDSEERVER